MLRRRVVLVGSIVVAVLVAAAAAFALFTSLKETATSSFSTASIGAVDIGSAETLALFQVADMEPGDQQQACFNAVVNNTGQNGAWALYSGGVSGTGLEDYLQIGVAYATPLTVGVPGIFSCSGFSPAQVEPFVDLSTFGSTRTDLATGIPLPSQYLTGPTVVGVRITMYLPDTADVQANASGLGASTSWVIENATG